MQGQGDDYFFPMPITPFMRDRYRGPAVFKWEVYISKPGDLKKAYIGEAQELCPKRLYSYLNPGKTQLAQKKINLDFREYLKEKLKVKLDVCEISELKFGGDEMGNDKMNSKWVRRMLVAAVVLNEEKRGYTVLDL